MRTSRPKIVPETGGITDLLTQFQTEQRQIAGVIDEWGVLEGIATIEDIVEIVVGDIRDEFDVDAREPSITPRDDGDYVVDGGVLLSALNEEIGTEFKTDDLGTIGGVVLDRLGRVPEIGDRDGTDDHVIEVRDVDGARISSVVIRENESPD